MDSDLLRNTRELVRECDAEIHGISDLKQHLESINLKIQKGEMPTVRDVELIARLNEALHFNRPISSGIRAKGSPPSRFEGE